MKERHTRAPDTESWGEHVKEVGFEEDFDFG